MLVQKYGNSKENTSCSLTDLKEFSVSLQSTCTCLSDQLIFIDNILFA